jgi:hypothetical protein
MNASADLWVNGHSETLKETPAHLPNARLILSGRGLRTNRAARINGTTFASYSLFELQCNIGTMKPDCEASEFQGCRESRPRSSVAYGAYGCLLPPLDACEKNCYQKNSGGRSHYKRHLSRIVSLFGGSAKMSVSRRIPSLWLLNKSRNFSSYPLLNHWEIK